MAADLFFAKSAVDLLLLQESGNAGYDTLRILISLPEEEIGVLIDRKKIQWAMQSFKPYKATGPDVIIPIMLQKAQEVETQKIMEILRHSLKIGHIPIAWREVKIVFIPKAGKRRHIV